MLKWLLQAWSGYLPVVVHHFGRCFDVHKIHANIHFHDDFWSARSATTAHQPFSSPESVSASNVWGNYNTWFYNLFIKMLWLPRGGVGEIPAAATAIQFVRKCCKTDGFTNILRRRNTEQVR